MRSPCSIMFDPTFVSIKVKGRFSTFLVRRGILASHPRSPEVFSCHADWLPILLCRKCVGLCLDTGDKNSTGVSKLISECLQAQARSKEQQHKASAPVK